MSNSKPRPTVDELFELLKRTSLPTVLVEGKDDIIFYRRIEEDLADIGIDMLPAGNKFSVLELRRRIIDSSINSPIAFVVDSDVWVYNGRPGGIEDVITTSGYSIENDLYVDGELFSLFTPEEKLRFDSEVAEFSRWFALSVDRYNRQVGTTSFREHPGKVLDDRVFYTDQLLLKEGESFPDELYNDIRDNFGVKIRGKSLFALITRQLSSQNRRTKFGTPQLMEVGAARKGANFIRIRDAVRDAISSKI